MTPADSHSHSAFPGYIFLRIPRIHPADRLQQTGSVASAQKWGQLARHICTLIFVGHRPKAMDTNRHKSDYAIAH